MTHIPLDIVVAIIDRVAKVEDSKTTLLACHAISKEWNAITRNHLFRTINISLPRLEPSGELWEMFHFVNTHPHIALCIRNIGIRGYESDHLEQSGSLSRQRAIDLGWSMELEPLYRTLTMVPGLKTLYLDSLPPCLAVCLSHMPKGPLPTICIPNVFIIPSNSGEDRDTGYDILRFLTMFNSVSELHVGRHLGFLEPRHVIKTPFRDLESPRPEPEGESADDLTIRSMEIEYIGDDFLRMLTPYSFVYGLRNLSTEVDFWNNSQEDLNAFFGRASASLEKLCITSAQTGNYVDLSVCRKLTHVTDLVYLWIPGDYDYRFHALHTAVDLLSSLATGVHGPVDSMRTLEISLKFIPLPRKPDRLLCAAVSDELHRLEEVILRMNKHGLRSVKLRAKCSDSLRDFFADLMSKSIAHGILTLVVGT